MARSVRVTYQVWPTVAEMALASAQLFAATVEQAVAKRGIARVAISGGTTPRTTFKLLADPAGPFAATVPWDKVQIFWVDERCVGPDHPESNYGVARELLLSKVAIHRRMCFGWRANLIRRRRRRGTRVRCGM